MTRSSGVASRRASRIRASNGSSAPWTSNRDGGGRSFRKIVRGFELTEEKERFYTEGLSDVGWPATILWADRDPALGEDRRRVFEEVLATEAKVISAKHFLQEDQAPAVAEAIAGVAGSA